jgi:PAS domain S-box-containing protein
MLSEPSPPAPAPTAPGADAELLELLLDASTDGVMDWDLVTNAVTYSARWKLLLGYEVTSLQDSPTLWSELSHPGDLARVRETLQDHLENFWPFTHTWRMKHANGEWRWVLCRAVTARDSLGLPRRLVAVFSDITERIQAEERHRALTSAIPDLLLRVQADGTLVDVKPPASSAAWELAWPVPGTRLSEWTPAAEWHQRVTGWAGSGQPAGAANCFEVTLVSGENRYHAELRVVASGDSEVVCIVRDVTQQRRLQTQLMQANKLESIGQLAAGIAHEINTPMQFIGDNLTFVQDACQAFMLLIAAYDERVQAARGRPMSEAEHQALDLLREEQDLAFFSERIPHSVETALEGVKRVANIVNAMKEFAHPGKAEKSPCDLNKEFETTITISANVWKYVAEMERNFDPHLPPVKCHANEINQVLLNLIVNASHAIGDAVGDGSNGRGLIRVATSARDGYAELRVSDSGTGIPVAVRSRIFDPFFTTKEVGRGTGQGLAIARNTVVDKHGGTIDFETELGKGTTFIVRLPLGTGPATPAAEG